MPTWLPPTLVGLVVVVVVVALDVGTRHRERGPDDDAHWLAGVIYFDRNDKRVVVPKRFGLGRTLNFAHPVAWVVLLAPLVVAVVGAVNRHRGG